MTRITRRRVAVATAAVLLPACARALPAQANATPADEVPDAVGCWSMRTDAATRHDAGESLGLPAQLRLDLQGDGLAVRDGMQRRVSWTTDGDGTLRVTLTAASGMTWKLELRRAEGEWVGAAHRLAESFASRRMAPRVTLVRGAGCPPR